jgi:hypothetical protein
MFMISNTIGSGTKTIVKENYEGSHDGWFEIQLTGKNPHLIHVEWCSELYQGASTDIDDCKAHNLIRRTIYPDPAIGENNFDLVTKPGTLRLNPNLVSGFWIKRQTDIVIEMKEEERLIVQVVRINPPPHAKAKEIIEEQEQQPEVVVLPTPIPTRFPDSPEQTTTTTTTSSVPFDFRSLGSGPFILLGLVCGFVFLVTALAIVRNKKSKPSVPETISPVYNFETNTGVDLMKEEDEEQQKKKDQAFFMTLIGDSNNREAFFLNIK